MRKGKARKIAQNVLQSLGCQTRPGLTVRRGMRLGILPGNAENMDYIIKEKLPLERGISKVPWKAQRMRMVLIKTQI